MKKIPLKMNDLSDQLSAMVTRVNEKNPYYLLAGVLLLIFIVDYLCVMQFQLRTLSALSPKLTTLSAELQTTKNNIQRLPQYHAETRRLEGYLASTKGRIRAAAEIPLILEDISIMANKHRVRIEQLMPDTTMDKVLLQNSEGRYFEVPIVIEARSRYHDLGRFLNQLEEEGALIAVDEFMIVSNKKDPRLHAVKLTVNAVVFEKTK